MRRKLLIAGLVAAVALPVVAWSVLVEVYGAAPSGASPHVALAAHPGGQLFVANAFGSDVEVFDLATGQAVASVPVGKIPHNLVAGPDGRLYVTIAGAQAVAAIDAASHQVVAERIIGEVPDNAAHRTAGIDKVRASASCTACHEGKALGSFPAAIALTPDGRLSVTELKTRQLSIVERATLQTARTVAIENPAPSAPSNVIFHPGTHEAYVLSRTYDEHQPPRAPQPIASGLPATDFDHDPAPGESWLTVYDPDMRLLRWRAALPFAGAFGAAFSPDGSELYVACRGADKVLAINVASHAVVRTYDVAANPVGLLLSTPDTLAVACFGARPGIVQFLDRATGKLQHTVEVPANPTQLARHPATGRLYVATSGTNQVVEIDGTEAKVLRTFTTGAAPVGVAVVP